MADFEDVSNILVPHRKKVHVAILILTILMIPGALKALEPIDMESYDMESPELTAERIINEEFTTTEIILGFVVSVRDPAMVGSTQDPVPLIDGGVPDWSGFAQVEEIVPTGRKVGRHYCSRWRNPQSHYTSRDRCQARSNSKPRSWSIT